MAGLTGFQEVSKIADLKLQTSQNNILTVLDAVYNTPYLKSISHEYPFERLIQEYFRIIFHKYSAKIVYALSELGFTSYHEIRTIMHLEDMSQIRVIIHRLEKIGLVYELSETDKDYNIIRSYWKNQYPNSHNQRSTILFTILPEFKEAIEVSKTNIIKSFISAKEFAMTDRRQRRYQKHYEMRCRQVEETRKAREEAIGFCMVCSGIIIKGSVRGKEYHLYPHGIVCQTCNRKASTEQILKWIRH